jgi:hypothetical protein
MMNPKYFLSGRVYSRKIASYLSMLLTFRRPLSVLAAGAAFVVANLASAPLHAQQQIAVAESSSSLELPDAPSYQQQQTPSAPPQSAPSTPTSQATNPPADPPQQTKRILGIMPNFSAVSADTKLPPQTPKQKFVIAAKNSFDYSSFVIAAIQSGISLSTNSYPDFGHGIEGYGKYYYHTLLDTADSNFMVSGLWPVVFRQDNRFYTLGHGRPAKRALYAASRVLITRTDAGNKTFNASEIVGTGAAAGVSTLYYPDQYFTWTKVGQKWLTSVIIDSANFTFKEFWPDINRKLFHTK